MGESAYIDCCRNINLDFLEIYGSQYVIEHVVAELNVRTEQRVYRSYSSDLLKAIAESLGVQVNYRFAEAIETPEDEDMRSADEIAMDVIKRAGLKGE